jgi:hypothetical protein
MFDVVAGKNVFGEIDSRGQFHQHFTRSFYLRADPKKCKRRLTGLYFLRFSNLNV